MRKLIGANWKMNCTIDTFRKMKEVLADTPESVDVFVAIPYVYIDQFYRYFTSKIKPGAQNTSISESGAFTGEVSAGMLAECGFEYVLVGHSERRQMFSETSEDINMKLKNALKHSIRPVLCVGEPATERNSGTHIEFLKKQFMASVSGIRGVSFDVAYEPVWAIGSGKAAKASEIEEALCMLKQLMVECEISGRVIYGGSVSGDNVGDLSVVGGCDGFLVGNKSLDWELQTIIDAASKIPDPDA